MLWVASMDGSIQVRDLRTHELVKQIQPEQVQSTNTEVLCRAGTRELTLPPQAFYVNCMLCQPQLPGASSRPMVRFPSPVCACSRRTRVGRQLGRCAARL
jgi:hypothetical protein